MDAIYLAKKLVVEALEAYIGHITSLMNSPVLEGNSFLKGDLIEHLRVLNRLVTQFDVDEWRWNLVHSSSGIVNLALSHYIAELENNIKTASEALNGVDFAGTKKRIAFAKKIQGMIRENEPLNELYYDEY